MGIHDPLVASVPPSLPLRFSLFFGEHVVHVHINLSFRIFYSHFLLFSSKTFSLERWTRPIDFVLSVCTRCRIN